ncbi:hypothetical protein PT7_0029 [Pusillimonas sp. T7-7]|nr:hypothetical protein PT7_0029 [Pusillimonas sp. T7-7]
MCAQHVLHLVWSFGFRYALPELGLRPWFYQAWQILPYCTLLGHFIIFSLFHIA